MKPKFVHTRNSSCSDDGLWMRIEGDGITVAVYEFAYWEDLDSSAVPDYGRYNVQAGYVDLTRHDLYLDSALRCCGYKRDEVGNVVNEHDGELVCSFDNRPSYVYCLAECLWSYGAKDVVSDESGNNRRALIRAAKGAL
jgi:hypothetical protein